jgi:formylmethanofuran dehydrogenase subunit C
MPLLLTPRTSIPSALDCSQLLDENWCTRTITDWETLTLVSGRQSVPLTDIFAISGSVGDDQLLQIQTSGLTLNGLGTGLKTGQLEVQGDIGAACGANLQGGKINVRGNAGDHLGQGMKSGQIIVHGHAGQRVGGPLPGAKTGMRGGEIHIAGDAGDEVGFRMRRGIISVHGNVGARCGANMYAGTIVVGQSIGAEPAIGMRRGSLVLLTRQSLTQPTGFKFACTYSPVWLRLYLKHLHQQLAWSNFETLFTAVVDRYSGDHGELGKGEIVVLHHA